MRFNLLSMLLLVTAVALGTALSLKRTPDRLMLIGSRSQQSPSFFTAGEESKWLDKSNPPKLSVADAYRISQTICLHLNSQVKETGFGLWETASISLKKLDEQRWTYFVRVEGTDSRNPELAVNESFTCMIMLDGSVFYDSDSCDQRIGDAMKSSPDFTDEATNTPFIND